MTRTIAPFAIALLFVAFLGFMLSPVFETSAAPAAQITPVAAENALTGDTAFITFYSSEALTADDQNCVDLQGYSVIDLEYVVDQGTTNTTTVQLEHTNGTPLTTNTDGQVVVSANTADADDLNRFDLYGRYTCVDIDVSNSETITWTVTGVARK